MIRFLATALLLFGSLVARASEIPKYPIEQRCDRFAAYAAGGAPQNRAAIKERCVLDQQEAYDRLKDDWKVLADGDQAQCLRMTGEEANYRSLGNCVGSLARRAEERRAKASGSFHY